LAKIQFLLASQVGSPGLGFSIHTKLREYLVYSYQTLLSTWTPIQDVHLIHIDDVHLLLLY